MKRGEPEGVWLTSTALSAFSLELCLSLTHKSITGCAGQLDAGLEMFEHVYKGCEGVVVCGQVSAARHTMRAASRMCSAAPRVTTWPCHRAATSSSPGLPGRLTGSPTTAPREPTRLTPIPSTTASCQSSQYSDFRTSESHS